MCCQVILVLLTWFSMIWWCWMCYTRINIKVQGVVTLIRPVEPFMTGIMILIYENMPWLLDCTQEGPWSLDILTRNLYVLLNLTLLWATWSPFLNVPWSLDLVQSNVLIPWFHFNPDRKWLYRPYERDYLLKLYETSWHVLESTMVYVVVMYSYIFM